MTRSVRGKTGVIGAGPCRHFVGALGFLPGTTAAAGREAHNP